jgi:hypothetical protein
MEVMRNMPRLPKMTLRQTVDSYRGHKRRRYEAAKLKYETWGFDVRDAHLSAFVKFEKQDVNKAPRIINPRSPVYNLLLARYLKHAEHHYFDAINGAFGGHTPATVIKGFNADISASILRAKWDRFMDPVAVGLDASKFDMHVSLRALRYEHSFYMSLFPGDGHLRALLAHQLRNRGVAYAPDGRVKFAMEGTRASGDINTSLGNCILMCAMVYSYAEHRGVKLELCNNGDDCVVIMERSDLTRFSVGLDVWFRGKGFAMQVETPVDEFERIVFCQTSPVQLSTGWRMLRNPRTCVEKDTMCLLPILSTCFYRKWLYAVGDAGAKLYAGAPVVGHMYKRFKEHGLPPTERFVTHLFKNTSWLERTDGLQASEIDARARCSYYYAFGILPDEQLAMEKFFSQFTIRHDGKVPVWPGDDNTIITQNYQ